MVFIELSGPLLETQAKIKAAIAIRLYVIITAQLCSPSGREWNRKERGGKREEKREGSKEGERRAKCP